MIRSDNLQLAALAALLALALVGCEGDDGEDGAPGAAGAPGADGSDGAVSLVEQTEIGPGADCANGGVRIDSGVDADGSGALDAGEINDTSFVCNGTGGVAGGGADPLFEAVRTRPLSSMVAITLAPGNEAESIPAYVKDLTERYARGENVLGGNFPLDAPARSTDFSGTLQGLQDNVVVSWFESLTGDTSADAPRYGANNDYLAYFGDGWDGDWQGDVVGSAPQFNGSADAAWMWSNHEYISNEFPLPLVAPQGQYMTLSMFLREAGVLDLDDPSVDEAWTQALVDTHIEWEKRQHGGSWLRIERQDNGQWKMVQDANAVRYDSSDATLTRITDYTPAEQDTDDLGQALPQNVVVGITADCSGGQSPWGTVFTAEENAQSQWGDLEDAWVSDRQFILDSPLFGEGSNISPDFSAAQDSEFGRSSIETTKHNRDLYGFLVEIDPGQAPANYYDSFATGGDGMGHRKLGSMGRARWENTDFVTGTDYRLVSGQPVVMYAANDRRAGRVYKWVSDEPYMENMTRAEVRALLDTGRLYVGHWEDLDFLTGLTKYDPADPNWAACAGDAVLNGSTDTASAVTARENCPALTEESPGQGVWIELSVDNTDDIAPNAEAIGVPTATVGEALQDVDWNGVGGFPDDNAVLSALFTAAAKLGVRELNRPEDVEWNPVDQTLYIAFTYHGRTIGMKQDGTLIYRNNEGLAVARDGTPLDPGEAFPERGIADLHSFTRADNFGSIFRLVEGNQGNPAQSDTFTFYPVWFGSQGDSAFDTARADNLAIDADGGVWFGTDGNTSGSTNASADGQHYLDLDPAHKAGQPGIVNPTYGLGIRIAHSANDAEATGPAWNANMDTLFYNAQHPGEGRDSAWPSSQP